MVRYHEAGRFCEKDQEWDEESAIFHLEHAADCGELEAIVGLGLMYSQLPHHILSEVTLEVSKAVLKVAKTWRGNRAPCMTIPAPLDSCFIMNAETSQGCWIL